MNPAPKFVTIDVKRYRCTRAEPPFCERLHLLRGYQRGVAGRGGEQCAVRPTELDRFIGTFAVEQPVDEPAREPVTTTDSV